MIKNKTICRAYKGALVKPGKYPISRKKGTDYSDLTCFFSRKIGDAIWGPGTDDWNHKYTKVRFAEKIQDPITGEIRDTWLFNPDDVEIV